MAAASAARAVGRRSRRLFDIFVAEVPWTVSSKELKEYFSQFGSVQRCQLPFDRDTGFHRRYCWIKFSTPEDVQNVLQKDSHILEGSKVLGSKIIEIPEITLQRPKTPTMLKKSRSQTADPEKTRSKKESK